MTTAEVTTIIIEREVVSSASTIFLIDCLSDRDKQSARTRHEGICDTLMSKSTKDIIHDTSRVFHERCQDRAEWTAAMNKIRDLSKRGLLPLVFIDGHGDSEKGLKLPSGEFISWKTYGVDLKTITDAARGELTVIAAFCHSFAFVQLVNKASDKLPFAFYHGYEGVVKAHVVDDETEVIYKSLIENGGQTLDFDKMQISRYDDYDHAINLIAPVIMMRLAPKTLVAKAPQYSKAQMRASLKKQFAREGKPLGQIRNPLKQAINSTAEVAVKLISSTMHETDRRRKFIEKILSVITQKSS